MTRILVDAIVKADNNTLKIHTFVVRAPILDNPPPLLQCTIDARLANGRAIRPKWRDDSKGKLAPGKYVLCCHAEEGTGKSEISVVDDDKREVLASQEFDFSVTLDHMLPFSIEA